MRSKIIAVAFALLFGISAPSLAKAANGYATGNVNMRSGPGTEYGRIATIPAGAGITIRGCLSGYNWCDVSFAGRRGWASSNYLQAVYQNRRRPLIFVGPRIRLPIITYHRPRPPYLKPHRPRPPHWKPNRPRPPHHRPRPRPQPR
ncbi:SH3 domain-containing protein [Mesorhizobium sp. A623]